jgi:hypothetical protein
MKKYMKYLFSWPVLAIEAAALIWVCWSWCNHWVSVFWALITVAVLVSELLNKIFSPKKQTVSNNIQDQRKEDPIRFWIMIAIWLCFAITLIGHFCLKGM